MKKRKNYEWKNVANKYAKWEVCSVLCSDWEREERGEKYWKRERDREWEIFKTLSVVCCKKKIEIKRSYL